jgi:hypothetical protein
METLRKQQLHVKTNKWQDSRKAATTKPTANNSTIEGKNHPEITQDDEIISTSKANSTPQRKGQNVQNKIKTRTNRNTETQRLHPKKNPTIDHQTCYTTVMKLHNI